MVLRYAIAKKTTSERATPRSTKIAALTPLLMLVSKTEKNTGPIVNDNKIPIGMAGKNSLILIDFACYCP